MEEWNFPYFTRKEMMCKCGECGGVPSKSFMDALVTVREECGFPFIVTSGYRCPEYNNEVAESGYDGPHTRGVAADIKVYGGRALRVIEVALKHGFTGIGVRQRGNFNSRFIHIDTVPAYTTGFQRPWIWSY